MLHWIFEHVHKHVNTHCCRSSLGEELLGHTVIAPYYLIFQNFEPRYALPSRVGEFPLFHISGNICFFSSFNFCQSDGYVVSHCNFIFAFPHVCGLIFSSPEICSLNLMVVYVSFSVSEIDMATSESELTCFRHKRVKISRSSIYEDNWNTAWFYSWTLNLTELCFQLYF